LGLNVIAGCSDASSGRTDADNLPRIVARQDIRLGDVEDPERGFSFPAGVDIDRDGMLYVLEATVPEIRVYEPGGELLRRIGRRGGGPGEFEEPPMFGLRGDTIWTIQTGIGRITLFDRVGQVLSTGVAEPVVVLLPQSRGYVVPRAMRPDGKFTSFMASVGWSRYDQPTGVTDSDRIPVPLVLFDAAGAVTDTIGWMDKPPPRMWGPPSEDDTRSQPIQVGGRRMSVPAPPTRLPWLEPVQDGYVLVEAPSPSTSQEGQIRVTRFGLSSDTIYSQVLRYTPARYTASELDSIAAWAARGLPGGMVPIAPAGSAGQEPPDNWQEIAKALRSAMNFPEYQVPVEWIWVAHDEAVWIRRRSADAMVANWTIISRDGTVRGELSLPQGAEPRWNRGEVLWAVEKDDLDVPWLTRFVLNW
jgi:hypothetical protein